VLIRPSVSKIGISSLPVNILNSIERVPLAHRETVAIPKPDLINT